MKSRVRSGDPVVGCFVSIPSPPVVEIMAATGFDVLCLDSEHGSFAVTDIESCVRAADVASVAAIVRVSEVGPEIGRALDAGAVGVVVPRVESAEQARAAVAATRYPPTGTRGAGPGRASVYGLEFAAYLGAANDTMACIVQIETAAGLEHVEEILAVEGIDLVFVGPGDLAVSLGVASGSAEHDAAIARICAAAAARGIPSGIFILDPAAVGPWRERGISFFLVGGDLAFLSTTARSSLDAARDVLAGADGAAA